MKYVIGFIGRAGHGKDASAKILKEELERAGYKAERYAFADHLKDQCRLLGWDSLKDERGRTLLQHLGDVMREYHGVNYFVDVVIDRIRQTNADVFFVPDVRFKSEAEGLRKLGEEPDYKVFLVRVKRDHSGWGKELTAEQKGHASEMEMDEIAVDMTIENDGTLDDLRRELEHVPFLEELLTAKPAPKPLMQMHFVTETDDNHNEHYVMYADTAVGNHLRLAEFTGDAAMRLVKRVLEELQNGNISVGNAEYDKELPMDPLNQVTNEPEYDNFPETYGKCPRCGEDVYDSQKYCDHCGQKLIWR